MMVKLNKKGVNNSLFEFINVILTQDAKNEIEMGIDEEFAMRHLIPYQEFLKNNIELIEDDEWFTEFIINCTKKNGGS